MFGFFSKKLTELTRHYIDWSRIGELLRSNNHRYTTDQLVVRGLIIASIVASGFVGAYANDQEKTHVSNFTAGMVFSLLGFVVSHTIAILPLIMKRYEMDQECSAIINRIKIKANNLSEDAVESQQLSQLVDAVIDHILTLSLSDESHGRASQTWGQRKRLLSELEVLIDQKDIVKWLEDEDLFEKLLTSSNAISCR